MGAGGPAGWPAGQAGRWIGLDSLCRILSSLSGANIGHQNSLRPSALDKEQRRRVEEGTVSKLNSVLLAAATDLWRRQYVVAAAAAAPP